MVRQYIGARYVPRFTGLYDPTQEYEALDVVDNGAGTSYISKIPTPAGTPLTNTEHWFVYGSTSGAIIDLQNRMSAVENGKNNKSELDVANFEGDTVEEKLHNALDYVKSQNYHLTLVCNDIVEVTESYDLFDANVGLYYEESWSTVIIKGAVFKFNGVPLFTGQANEPAYCPTFDSCEFNANVADYILDGSLIVNYINPNFVNCIFYHVGVVNNASVDNSIYVQSPHLVGCKIFRCDTEFIKTPTVWNGIIDDCQFEQGSHSAIHVTRTVNEFMITNSTFEGFYDHSPIVFTRGALNVMIKDTYFEKNRPHSIEIGQDYIYHIEIVGNSFYISNNEVPIDITGNTTNAEIVVNDNNLITNEATDYLANFEPYSAGRFGYHNKKLVEGVNNRQVFPTRTTLGFQAGWNQELTDWTYDSGNNCYKCVYDFYGQLNLRTPFLMGLISGLSRATNSTIHSLGAIFTIMVIGTRNTDTNIDEYQLLTTKLSDGVGRTNGITEDDVIINADLATDPDDSTHHIITIKVICNNGSYFGTGLHGRVFDLMEVGVLEKAHT